MKIQLRLIGYEPVRGAFRYHAFAESGRASVFEDEDFVSDGTYELPDDMFQLDSGYVSWQCDECGLEFRRLTRPGGEVKCPMCGAIGRVPEDAVMEEDE